MTSKEEKEKIISNIYNDEAGFGSIKATLEDAKKKDKSITYEDVRKWITSQDINQIHTKIRGQNSFIANSPKEEYQMDLLFFTEKPGSKFKTGVLMVDIFTKYTQVVPIKSKQIPDVLAGIMECTHKNGWKTQDFVY